MATLLLRLAAPLQAWGVDPFIYVELADNEGSPAGLGSRFQV